MSFILFKFIFGSASFLCTQIFNCWSLAFLNFNRELQFSQNYYETNMFHIYNLKNKLWSAYCVPDIMLDIGSVKIKKYIILTFSLSKLWKSRKLKVVIKI